MLFFSSRGLKHNTIDGVHCFWLHECRPYATEHVLNVWCERSRHKSAAASRNARILESKLDRVVVIVVVALSNRRAVHYNLRVSNINYVALCSVRCASVCVHVLMHSRVAYC